MDDLEKKLEEQWLETVVAEAQRQYLKYGESDEKLKEDALRTQKELWEEVGPIASSGELDQIVEFMEYIGSMKQQKRSHVFIKSQKDKYFKIAQSPYFARIDFKEEGQEDKPFYIGTFNLIDEKYSILVYDWRAPVSGMFYDFDVGPASYLCPKGTVEGEITRKRQYKIADGKLVYMFDSSLKIDDEMLRQILGRSADSKMKAIVTSIQREQNRAIRNESFQNLIVQGPAGSGKTSVALHRAAYLLYKHKDTVTEKNILILSPNAIFNDYISEVLPELGEENLLSTTFEAFMQGTLRTDLVNERFSDMMEYLYAGKSRPYFKERFFSMCFKSSDEFLKRIKAYADCMQNEGTGFFDIKIKDKLIVSAEEQKRLFREEYAFLPLERRLMKLRARIEYLLNPLESARKKEISEMLKEKSKILDRQELLFKSTAIVKSEFKEVRENVERITTYDPLKLYRAFFDHLVDTADKANRADMESIRSFTFEALDAKKLYYEDQIALFYLKSAWGGAVKTAAVRFLIADEAQDYTLLQLEILRLLFGHAKLTLLGDPSQTIHPYMREGVYGEEKLFAVFPEGSTLHLQLSKSYRSTLEITRFARRILHRPFIEDSVERHGSEPVTVGFKDEAELRQHIVADVQSFTEKGFSSIGILTRTKREAVDVYAYMRRKIPLKAVLSGDEEYVRGTVVMPVYLAKGLEFDAVIVYNASKENYTPDERLYLYTACTRALHALHVCYVGEMTELLDFIKA
ncbi:MAG TPA: UvrD-helicase domain-containing protein [Clostridia bacterium]|nr:UvrD-helicase domain-containing protein [Clostridia bacterium]